MPAFDPVSPYGINTHLPPRRRTRSTAWRRPGSPGSASISTGMMIQPERRASMTGR